MAGYNYITETGIIIPDTSENLTSVQQEFKETFGEDLVLNPETPQGVIINQLTLGRNAVAENNAQLANQINPNYAGGVFLDAIMSLTGMQRRPAQFSSVLAEKTIFQHNPGFFCSAPADRELKQAFLLLGFSAKPALNLFL